jgi:hypothetical protein
MINFNFFKKSKYFIVLILIIVSSFGFYQNILAEYMQSSNYKMQQDTINFGGRDSSSATYKLNDTVGEISTGDSNSESYYMHAGYWQMNENYISISSPTDLVMSSMGGLSGGSSEGTMSWLVTTDNTAGYNMSVSSSTSPAMQSVADSISDYVPAGSNPDYNFTNASNNSSFGFSPEGTEALPRFRDNGASCNIGSSETTGKCWDGFSTIPKVVAGSSTSNHPSGSTVSLRLRAESGADHIQTSGVYNVVITATATSL